MTFEEFFVRKKIDLKALKASDESLYNEFQIHYAAMGEKSFDHSKKFWFNRLRKNYHLQEERAAEAMRQSDTAAAEIPTTVQKDIVAVAKTDSKTSADIPISKKPAGFKPRFKAPVSTTASEETSTPINQPTSSLAETAEIPLSPKPDEVMPESKSKPAGFKPRFKAGITSKPHAAPDKVAINPQLPEPAEQKVSPEDTSTTPSQNKPAGFKPRFKAGVTGTAKTQPPAVETTIKPQLPEPAKQKALPEDTSDTPSQNKPAGFKPRFKAGVTAVKPSEAQNDDKPATPAPSEQSELEALHEDNHAEQLQNKPTGFKPRFKAGVTGAAKTQPPTEETAIKPQLPEPAEQKALSENASDTSPQNKPAGFKPRFKAGITKNPKKED